MEKASSDQHTFSGNGAEITIGTEMIGQSIQCQANNGLYSDTEMATSQAVQIDPYCTLLIGDGEVVRLVAGVEHRS